MSVVTDVRDRLNALTRTVRQLNAVPSPFHTAHSLALGSCADRYPSLPLSSIMSESVDKPSIYREQLSSIYHGLALWDPKPVERLHKQPGGHVSIGDVGYLDNGAFIRMFNVTLPWDDPSNKLLGEPGPWKYELIKPSYSGNVRDSEIREGEYYTPHVSKVDNIGADRYEE
jgi:hypothetical protein